MKSKKINKVMFAVAFLGLTALTVFAAEDVSTYLIMNDIPPYQRLTQSIDMITKKVKTIPGYTVYSHPGIFCRGRSFLFDHTDMTYRTEYQSEELDMGMVVEVTKHPTPLIQSSGCCMRWREDSGIQTIWKHGLMKTVWSEWSRTIGYFSMAAALSGTDGPAII